MATKPCPRCKELAFQVVALVGALEKTARENHLNSRHPRLFDECGWLSCESARTLLANLPSEALEIARKAQAHDAMAAENERLRGALREHGCDFVYPSLARQPKPCPEQWGDDKEQWCTTCAALAQREPE